MLAAPAAANNGLPCFQQGDCPSADAGSTVSATAAAQSNQMPVVSSDQMLAVQSGQLAEAAANANDPALKQGDCSPADADSAVRYVENSLAARDEQPPDQTAANSLAAAAATARLMESPPSGSQQGDCSAADTGRSARQNTTAAQNAQDTAAARSDPAADSLAATAETARLMESPPSGSQQGDCPAAGADQTAHRGATAAAQNGLAPLLAQPPLDPWGIQTLSLNRRIALLISALVQLSDLYFIASSFRLSEFYLIASSFWFMIAGNQD